MRLMAELPRDGRPASPEGSALQAGVAGPLVVELNSIGNPRPTPRPAGPAAAPAGKTAVVAAASAASSRPGHPCSTWASCTAPRGSTSTRTSTVPSMPASRAISGTRAPACDEHGLALDHDDLSGDASQELPRRCRSLPGVGQGTVAPSTPGGTAADVEWIDDDRRELAPGPCSVTAPRRPCRRSAAASGRLDGRWWPEVHGREGGAGRGTGTAASARLECEPRARTQSQYRDEPHVSRNARARYSVDAVTVEVAPAGEAGKQACSGSSERGPTWWCLRSVASRTAPAGSVRRHAQRPAWIAGGRRKMCSCAAESSAAG